MKKLLILVLLMIPLVSAEKVYIIETDLQDYNISISEGFPTNSIKEGGRYEVRLIKDDQVMHKQYFDAGNDVEVFPKPECFDENMRLIRSCKGIIHEERTTYEIIQVPVIEGAEYIEVLDEGKLLFKINIGEKIDIREKIDVRENTDIRKKSYSKLLTILGLIIVIIIAFIIGKYYKNKKTKNEQVIR